MKSKQVEKLVKKYANKMLLHAWDIHLVLSKQDVGDNGAAAMCQCNYVYKHATVTLYKSAFKGPNDIHHIIIHELAHLITEPLYAYCVDFMNGRLRTHDDVNEQREAMTEHFAKIISRLR